MVGEKTIGIVGGGQLGRMLTLAAAPLGFKVIVVDPSENCPAAQVGAQQIKAGLYEPAALRELGRKADYVTVEIEHLDTATLQELTEQGIPVNPWPATIRLIQDKFQQKEFLKAHGIPVADFEEVRNKTHAAELLDKYGGNMLLKARRGAYDGRGNALILSKDDLDNALNKMREDNLYAEAVVPFKKELAVMIARDMNGSIAVYPVVETVHERNICTEVLAPAPIGKRLQKRAEQLARQVAEHLEGAGMFGIEMFLTDKNEVLINEIAPRVHNSGHYTMNACATSQFEQHVRAISGLPLGSTDMLVPASTMVNVLGERNGPTNVQGLDVALIQPHTYVHMYGKSPTKIDRKMGHINANGKTLDEAKMRAHRARKNLSV